MLLKIEHKRLYCMWERKRDLLYSSETVMKFMEDWNHQRMGRGLEIITCNKMSKKWILVKSGKILRRGMKKCSATDSCLPPLYNRA